MMRVAGHALASAVAMWSTVAMSSPFRPLPPDATRQAPPPERAAPDGSLPFAQGPRFATLDAYLAFRREQGAIDLPWYEEVSPGVYELRTSMRPAPPPRRFTRAQLARQFGFAR